MYPPDSDNEYSIIQKYGPATTGLILCCIILAILTVLNPDYWKYMFSFPYRHMYRLIRIWLTFALVIPPMVLIVKSGGIDLSVGAVIASAGGIYFWFQLRNYDLGYAFAFSMFFVVMIGSINAFLVNIFKLHWVIVTGGMAIVLNGLNLTTVFQRLMNEYHRKVEYMPFMSSTITLWVLLAAKLNGTELARING